MERILGTYNYGICLFSLDVLQDFLKREKIRSKKLLEKFQKDKELYLTTQKEGIWFPIVQINSGEYTIGVDGFDEPFGDDWDLKLEYGGFNLEIKDNFCVCDTGMFYTFNPDDFGGNEHSYEDMEGKVTYNAYKYDLPSGKYLVTVKGYAHKQSTRQEPKYSFWFSLVKTDAFVGFKNPREEELYDFNIGWLANSHEAVVYWLSEEEGGKGRPTEIEKDKFAYNAAIQAGEDDVCHIYMKFDFRDLKENSMVNKCRVDNTLHMKKHEGLLVGGAEHIIYEEKRKGGKSVLTKIGRIVIL